MAKKVELQESYEEVFEQMVIYEKTVMELMQIPEISRLVQNILDVNTMEVQDKKKRESRFH